MNRFAKSQIFTSIFLTLAILASLLMAAIPAQAAGTATVSIDPSSQAVANGAPFSVNLAVNTDTAIRGWQANISFDAAKMTLNSVTEGTFLSAYATANSGGTVSGGAVTIDNVNGTATLPGFAISNAGTSGPSGSGTLAVLNFTAKANINDYATITPTDVYLGDVSGSTSTITVTANSGTVSIGDVAMADLVVSSATTAKVDEDTYTVTYTITNNGTLAAAASTASVVIDGSTTITASIDALAAGASQSVTTATQTISGSSDTIVITADSEDVISEGSETNNTRTISYALVGETGNTVINSNILAKLALTAPADVDPWDLEVGSNNVESSMNVKCNTEWQVQVYDDNGLDGKLTKWLSGTYDTDTQLSEALEVNSVELSGTSSTIATGDASGQSEDDGEDVTVDFDQTVHYADPVLTDGSTYHIVITFSASTTI